MDYLILSDVKGGAARLTTDARANSNGIPVLTLDADDVHGEFRAADSLPTIPMTGADLVVIWGSQPNRTNEEKDAARRYLLDWANGPQL